LRFEAVTKTKKAKKLVVVSDRADLRKSIQKMSV